MHKLVGMFLLALTYGTVYGQWQLTDLDWQFSNREIVCDVNQIVSIDVILPQEVLLPYPSNHYHLDWALGIFPHNHPSHFEGRAEIADVQAVYWDFGIIGYPCADGQFYLEHNLNYPPRWEFGICGMGGFTVPQCTLLRVYVQGIYEGECVLSIYPTDRIIGTITPDTDRIIVYVGEQPLKGDINKDGRVDLLDLCILAKQWLFERK